MAIHHIFVFATINRPFPPMLVTDQGGLAHTEQQDKDLTTPLIEGDQIFWTRAANVESIDEILFESHSEFFDMHRNTPENGGSIWAYVVGDIPRDGVLIKYQIKYTVRGEQHNHTQDPKLSIKPRASSGSRS